MNDSRFGDDGEWIVNIPRKEVKRKPRLALTGDPKFLERLDEFVVALQAKITDHRKKNFPNLPIPIISVENGVKNVRIVRDDGSQRSVHCFIQKDNGDILKAAGWKAPAKHARGNIYVDLLKGVTEYGAEYR